MGWLPWQIVVLKASCVSGAVNLVVKGSLRGTSLTGAINSVTRPFGVETIALYAAWEPLRAWRIQLFN